MIETATPSSGLFQSLRRLADTALGIIHNRAELFAVELQEERAHLIAILLWISALLFFGMLGVLVLTATLIMVCPAEYRIYLAGAFSLVYLVGAGWAYSRLQARLQSPAPFAQSISEVQKDRDLLFK